MNDIEKMFENLMIQKKPKTRYSFMYKYFKEQSYGTNFIFYSDTSERKIKNGILNIKAYGAEYNFLIEDIYCFTQEEI